MEKITVNSPAKTTIQYNRYYVHIPLCAHVILEIGELDKLRLNALYGSQKEKNILFV